ncbi:MAG: InlB B-repeat-containing protein [Firmicutes bacterium]|nr:InlB B-repeat-containing protein [Bacillota bacterium]
MKKIAAFLLAAVMVTGLVPAMAFAEEPNTGNSASEGYVLMNIPYDDFYEEEGVSGVDAVTSATKNKPRTGTLAGGSYHIDPEGTDITGVIYPVYVEDMSVLADCVQITDDSSVDITVTNRGQTTTTTYAGKDALFESASYSYYVLDEEPSYYKELSGSNGSFSFSVVKGDVTEVTGVEGEVTVGARHADIEIKLSGTTGINQGDKVSGIVLTFDDNSKMGLKHIENIWRATEIGGSTSDLGGKTIKNIRYYTQTSVIDFPVNIIISDAGYVLMNIPYADFYKAELGENAPEVDAVTSATKNKPRTGTLAGGSYHVDPAGTDISGVIYPVFVTDTTVLEDFTEITDESSVDITVTNRGQTTTTTYEGKDALFESASYSYYVLDEKPARYKTLTAEDGELSFSAVSGRAVSVEGVTYEAEYNTHHKNFVEIHLSDTEFVKQGDTISGAIVTFSDGSSMALRHIVNIWRGTWIGSDKAEEFAGKTITNIRYYTQNGVYDYPVNIPIKQSSDPVSAAFTDSTTVSLTGLPDDIQNPKATVQTVVGRGETPTVIADGVDVANGVVTTTEAAESGTTYEVIVSSDNYAEQETTIKYFLSQLIGTYQPLFEGATFNEEYDHYWHDYTAAVVGASGADDMVAYMKSAVNADGYGEEAVPPNFYCGFTNDVKTIEFGGEDGATVTFTKEDGTKVTRSYAFLKDAAATGQYGDYPMSMDGYLFKAKDAEENDPFAYLLMFPDTPDTTYHLEFRYGAAEEDLLKLLEGPCGYWVASAIQTSALTEEDEDTLQKVISLFVVENMAEMTTEETKAQRRGLVGTWDCDFSAFPEYGDAKMYIVLSADGTGKTYADFTGTGKPALTAEYTFFAYDNNASDGKESGTYIALNPTADTVTPGEYEITRINGKKALVFTSNEGVITYYLRKEQSGGGGGGGSSAVSKFTLTYETNGGSEIKAESYSSGTKVTLDKTPVREGYTFTGWYSDKELTQKITSIQMNSSKTVYAGWTQNGSQPVNPDAPDENTSLIEIRIGSTKYKLNGKDMEMDSAPFIDENDRTMLPVRVVANALGISDDDIAWDNETKTASFTRPDGKVVSCTVGVKNIKIGDEVIEIDTAPVIRNDRIYLPMRALFNAFNVSDAHIIWDGASKTVTVTKEALDDIKALTE